MGKVLIIGSGGVGNVVTKKCAQLPQVFSEIILASRTIGKCRQIAKDVEKRLGRTIRTAQVDADSSRAVSQLIKRFCPDLVINLALPYQNLAIMDACLDTRVDYIDTSAYEPVDRITSLSYDWQWKYHDRFGEKGIMAVLSCGFDPGVTNIFCAYAQRRHFDRIDYIDMLDCNAGDHGHPFATNFNPEVNIREITQSGRYWENGQWQRTKPLSVSLRFDYPTIGPRKSYLIYHEEVESIVKHIKPLKRVRFWMTFTDPYLTHLWVLENVGMTRIDPVKYDGRQIAPLQLLKTLLPDPASLAANYKGKTCIGCILQGLKDKKPHKRYIYNICDHAECYREVGSQAISYTGGVPVVIGAMLMLTGRWRRKGVFNVEQLDPEPFMKKLNEYGLQWTDVEFHNAL